MRVKKQERSRQLYRWAKEHMPGGVSSPVRAFQAVKGEPIFISHAQGSKIYDVDGNEYIDYVGSWGPLILGHAHPEVRQALTTALERGTSYGAPTELEIQLAQQITRALPASEQVRFVNSGTEATMSALRLARAFTQRDKIIKFDGCYHGHADLLLVRAGSGVATLGLPNSPGIPAAVTQETLVAPFNDLRAVEALFQEYAEDVAAVIVEPIAGNMGVVPPKPGFLEGLRELTREHHALLIFDEVITGFRVSYGGAQALYDIAADLSCLGKIIGGGLPVGAYGGRREVMKLVAPCGPVYQAGTLSGNPLAMTAGLATLKQLTTEGCYEQLESSSLQLVRGLSQAAEQARIPVRINRVGSMFTLFFTGSEVSDYATAKAADTERYARYFHEMLTQGIYLPPSQFEAWFVSLAHTAQDIARTIEASTQAFAALG
jgi:glutamate-1-semialdehyde 2,1-aminomutase